MNNKTHWSKNPVGYTAADDLMILSFAENEHQYWITRPEIEWLCEKIFEFNKASNRQNIQLVKDWNECKGLWDIDENPMEMKGEAFEMLIQSLGNVISEEEHIFPRINRKDLGNLIEMLEENKKNTLKIEWEF